MTTPAPPHPFPAFNTEVKPAGLCVTRIHDPAFAGHAANPCMGGPTRFAPIHTASGDCIPTLYAASSLDAAAYESVFHDVPAVPGPKAVRLSKVTSRTVSELQTVRPVRLATLFAPDLSKLGLTRAQLIDTLPTAYAQTARWAEAFHRADPTLDGLVWTSRRCDPDLAYVFFADRLTQADWQITSSDPIAGSATLLPSLRQIAARADITLTM